jgi:multidrug efflux pump subunit AcrA (membrane-fusion protein)
VKQLEVAKSRSAAAVQTVERLKRLEAAISAQELADAQVVVDVRQGEVAAAQLAVAAAESHYTAMEFEFNQAFVTSPLDGIVATVDVHPGERRQLSGSFRGVIVLDPRVLNCRCWLNLDQLKILERIQKCVAVPPGQGTATSSVTSPGCLASIEYDGREWGAKLLSIGILADSDTGRIPVILEVQNPDETLRAGIQVNVRFRNNSDADAEQNGEGSAEVSNPDGVK